MSYSKKIIESLKQKDLSEGTIENYMRILKKLNEGAEIKNLKFLKDKENVLKIIGTKKKNTQRNYLIAVCSVLKQFKAKPYETLYKFYFENMMNMNKILKQEEATNTATETQKKNWVGKEEVNKKLEDLTEFANSIYICVKNKSEYKKLLQFMILSLYTLTAPRRNKDYQEMKIVNRRRQADNKAYNYLVLDDFEFIFNNYKTSKVEEQKIIEIPEDLRRNINIYLNYRNGKTDYFLTSYEGDKLKNINAITYLINDIFDKKVGCSMLRHIYLTEKYGPTLKELKKDSANMSHSLETQKNYIKI